MALAIRPTHPSPSSFHPQPLHQGFFSVAMDQAPHTRPSLPPISSLIDSMRSHAERTQHEQPEEARRRSSGGSLNKESTSPERHSISRSPRHLPASGTELPPASSFAFQRLNGNVSPSLSSSNHTQYPPSSSTGPTSEPYAPRKSSYPPIPDTNSYPPIPEPHHWSAPPPQSRSGSDVSQQDTTRATAVSTNGTSENGQQPGLSQQRPLPPFPSPQTSSPRSLASTEQQPTQTWQHHHYYPAANPPSYPQTQERYICPTCSKPFSRPSSLKIHSYSHTGEKPYKCKHDGCGKHFSVRSNMKRHEKGCHGGDGSQSPRPIGV